MLDKLTACGYSENLSESTRGTNEHSRNKPISRCRARGYDRRYSSLGHTYDTSQLRRLGICNETHAATQKRQIV
jgi:hypothetical protein